MTRDLVRPSTADDIEGLNRLFAEVFGKERAGEVWRWKYFDNPRGTASYLCESEGRIIAHCGGTPVRVHDGGRTYVALQSVDFMSSAAHAGGLGRGGAFARTARAFFDAYCGETSVPMVYGFPGERHRMLGERILGYRPVERIVEFTLEPSPGRHVSVPLGKEHLGLFERSPIRLGAIRDTTYLRWRYLAHPVHRYEIVRAGRLGGLLGEMAAIVRRDEGRLLVMELGGDFTAGSMLALARALAAGGLPAVYWGSPDHPIGRMLTIAGFHATPRDHFIECRFFFDRPVPEAGSFDFSMGDYDVH